MVYIVDDNIYVLRGMSLRLKSAQLDCLPLDSAEKFLEVYKPGSDDLLILDMHLTGMNGCELLHRLSQLKTVIPVIVITAFDEQSSRDCAKKYGSVAFFRKPIDGEALIDVIRFNLACREAPCM